MKIHQSKLIGQKIDITANDISDIVSVGYTVKIPNTLLNKYVNKHVILDENGFKDVMATVLSTKQYITKPIIDNLPVPYFSYKKFYKSSTAIPNEMFNWFDKRCDNYSYKTGFITEIWYTDVFKCYDFIADDIKGHVFCKFKVDFNSKRSSIVFLTDTDEAMQAKILSLYNNFYGDQPWVKFNFDHTVLENPIEVTVIPTLIIADS